MPSSRLVLAEYFNIHDVIRSRSHTHPPRLLRAFSETRDLTPGVSKRVELTLDRIPVSYWDERIGRWVIEHGEHGVSVGPSSGSVLPLTESSMVDKTGVEWVVEMCLLRRRVVVRGGTPLKPEFIENVIDLSCHPQNEHN